MDNTELEIKLQSFVNTLDEYFNSLDDIAGNEGYKKTIEDLWLFIVNIENDDNKNFLDFKTSIKYEDIRTKLLYSQDHYEKVVESEDARTLLASKKNKLDKDFLNNKNMSKYNRGGLELAQYDIKLIDAFATGFDTFIMVGCGSLSYTMLDFIIKHPDKKCIGIDVEQIPIDESNRIRKKFKIQNIRYERINGSKYSYGQAGKSLIFVASLVKPKNDVLTQIANTAEDGSIVVVRNPVEFCNLLYENAPDKIPRLKSFSKVNLDVNKEHLQQLNAFIVGSSHER